MSLATYYLDYGCHVARLRRCRRHAYAPTSNTASQDNHEKINSWVSFTFLYVFEYGAPLGGPLGRRSSAFRRYIISILVICSSCFEKQNYEPAFEKFQQCVPPPSFDRKICPCNHLALFKSINNSDLNILHFHPSNIYCCSLLSNFYDGYQ